MKARIKVSVIFLGFWLLSALVPSYVSLVQASDVPISQASSSEWVWRWDNPWTLTAYRGDIANSTFFPTPQVFWNGTHWVDYVYEEHADYYLLRNSYIAVEVYDYYAKFYDVNYSEVRLYDERWEVQRWRQKQGRWDDLGAQSGTPTFTAITNKSGVWLTKSFTSWGGVLNITYTLRVASPLKHAVTWKSFITDETEFRILQKWSGIVGGRVKHAQGEENVIEPATLDSTWFSFMKLDGTFTILQNFWDTGFLDEHGLYRNYVLQPTTIDAHAQGMKADFIFQNSTLYTIPKDGTIKLDPTTSTIPSESPFDGYMFKLGYTYPPTGGPYVNTGSNIIFVGQDYREQAQDPYSIYRGYISFMTTTIPNNASIQSAMLKLNTTSDHSDQDFYVYVMGGSQPIYGDDGLQAADWGNGTIVIDTWFTGYYPGDGGEVNFTIGTDQINKWGRTQFELRSSREGTTPTGKEYVIFHSAESSEYVPKLEVTWKLQTEEVEGTEWYFLNASNNKAAIYLDGGVPSYNKVKIFSLYNDPYGIAFKPYEDGPYKDKFIQDLHASGFDIMTLKTNLLEYNESATWVYDATMWLREQGYQHISLFGFSGGGVVVAYEIQRDYAGIWHAAVVASAPVNWAGWGPLYNTAQTGHKAKVPTAFIAPEYDHINSRYQMKVYYDNMVIHKEWHNWTNGHSPFPYTCINHTASYPPGETVAEATSNWYLKVFDVAVTDVSLYHFYRAVERGETLPLLDPGVYPTFTQPIEIRVTVKNEGSFSETFNVTAYNNTSPIGTQTVNNLAPGADTTLTFTWEPYLPGYPDDPPAAWPYPTHTFSANATRVPGETDTDDNTYVDGSATVKWPGDANGDGRVDIYDLTILSNSWYSKPGDPNWDPRADFNGDGIVNIYDLTILSKNWRKGPLD